MPSYFLKHVSTVGGNSCCSNGSKEKRVFLGDNFEPWIKTNLMIWGVFMAAGWCMWDSRLTTVPRFIVMKEKASETVNLIDVFNCFSTSFLYSIY